MNKAFIEEKPSALLNVDNNAKTVKGRKRQFLTGILYLFPHKAFGLNICPMAEIAECAGPCLNLAGRGAMSLVQASRLRKTWLFHHDRDWFMAQLYRDIEALVRKAEREGMDVAVRLNGLSDIDWESFEIAGDTLMNHFTNVVFYDYTKIPRVPKHRNYHLTFSYSDAPAFQKMVKRAEKLRMNMSVVFQGPLPETYRGRPVIDGDLDDLRFLDPDGCIVGLRAKGPAKKDMDSRLIVRVA